MATRNHENPTEREGSRTRLPSEQQKVKEKDGRIRRFLCNVLQLRVLAYIVSQPAAFLFILSLFLIAFCMPFLGVFIKNSAELPDLDSMRNWNAYLGKLQEQEFCLGPDADHQSHCTNHVHVPNDNYTYETVGVSIEFYVDKSVVDNLDSVNTHLVANLTGSDLKTQISSGDGGRVDSKISILIHVDLSTVNTSDPRCGEDCYPVKNTCVFITAPVSSIPTRRPYFQNDSFGSKIVNSPQQPALCHCSDLSQDTVTYKNLLLLSTSAQHCDDKAKVKPAPETFRHHGLITIYLGHSDQESASARILLSTIFMIALGVAFALAIACTDRPPKHKPSTE